MSVPFEILLNYFNKRMRIKYLSVTILVFLSFLFLEGCKDSPGRHLTLGEWYLQKGLLNEAVLEFREVTRLMPDNHQDISREDFRILTRAHYNLALVYTKKGWWDVALEEAMTCFDLQPTKENYDLLKLIRKRIELDNEGAVDS